MADKTAKFCKMMNSFFDCANIRSTKESLQKRNDFLAPYRSTNDKRFQWLDNTFIKYLEDWKAAIESREGEYTAVLRDIAPSSVEGNVAGRHSGKRQKWFSISDEPLPKRKSNEKQSKE
ncbi:Hypothetical predicted protein [Paramuricea clavata]|uniref:Uncharacterized protein n=1 Tax=Paramuricea clavata TaxID=317549 RepID=A0A7D9DDR1_PARCT|nr:Hypothetical predicted protein [Paramuricea clavata]